MGLNISFYADDLLIESHNRRQLQQSLNKLKRNVAGANRKPM